MRLGFKFRDVHSTIGHGILPYATRILALSRHYISNCFSKIFRFGVSSEQDLVTSSPRRPSLTPVYTERFGLAFSTGHPFELRNTLHLSDVHEQPYLDRINCEYSDHIDELCRSLGIEIESAHRSEREDWILAIVAAGMGVPPACGRSRNHPQVSLVTVAGRSHSPAIDAFADAVRD
ncbi:LysR family transcriptional regulator substrate-binding protein [Mesorhizobium sp. Root102]|uniref:LysR family transcriptional regulator substrate-binding protein n=1 Tax=Mesorhizobium sp. Root102 TaxID=1736422 RepID=UPI001FCDEA82|nr:LysR family transcriptional regulator substrate-binding protein [Mesorhizobium sp. Root102]